MSGRPIRVVCFDLGGVVVRICRSWEEACARAGVPVREPSRFMLEHFARRRREIVDDYQTGRMPCDVYWRAIADATGALYTPGEVELVHSAWTMEDYPGVQDVIAQLNQRAGIVTACLSNTNPRHWSILRGERGPERPGSPAISGLQRTLVSHELGLAKPDRAIYEAAEKALDTNPEEILFFDDLEENIQAAAARGWRAVPIDHTRDTAAQMREHLKSYGVIV